MIMRLFKQDVLNEINNALMDAHNFHEDGSVNWDFVSGDVHVELEVTDKTRSDIIGEIVDNFADMYEANQRHNDRAQQFMV